MFLVRFRLSIFSAAKHGRAYWCIDLILIAFMQNNVDEAVKKLKAQGIEAMGVVCHVSNAQHRKNLIEKTVQVSNYLSLLCFHSFNKGIYNLSCNWEN